MDGLPSRVFGFALLTLVAAGIPRADEPPSPSNTATCPPIDGVTELLGSGKVLLLGEIHGTAESPAFVEDVACHAARAGLKVIVGVELPPSLRPRVDAFLDSSGTVEDRSALIADRVWQRSYQDGRTSHAMADLFEGVRALRRQKLDVGAALFDAPGTRGGQQRDADMAANLAAVVKAAPQAMLIVLTGDVHSRITPGTPRNRDYEPMGYLLARAVSKDRVTALKASYASGTAWICGPDCGVVQIRARGSVEAGRIKIGGDDRPSGHDGWYGVGPMTASPPAKKSRGEAIEAPVAAEPSLPRKSASESSVATAASSPVEVQKLEGVWQAHDFASNHRTWKIRFDAGSFHAESGPDDWYSGTVALRPDGSLAELDFNIDDCQCSYKGMTSRAIYYWDEESMVVSAPRPGSERPTRFVERSGQMMRLVRLAED